MRIEKTDVSPGKNLENFGSGCLVRKKIFCSCSYKSIKGIDPSEDGGEVRGCLLPVDPLS